MLHQLNTLLIVALTATVVMLPPVKGQQDFTTAQVPDPFTVGDYYPPRLEVDVCRPIRDYIDRNSARFTNELVTNTNSRITFSTSDSRIMTSRMQSRLNTLADSYFAATSTRMTVRRAWTQFPNSQLNNMSLHYEGRSVQVRLPSGSNYDRFLQLAVEAAFDWVSYNASRLVVLSVIPTNCDRNVDGVFVLDQSGSVGRTNHATAIQFIQNIVTFFNIGLNQTRFGFVAYSNNAHLEFDLNDYTTLNSLSTRIGNVNYRGGGTRTGRALDEATFVLNPDNNLGARPNDGGVPKIVVLITDGRSHDNVATPSNVLKGDGVIVYTVGIGNADVTELRTISSDPDNEHVFLLNSFRDAAGFVDFLSVTTCETPAIIDPDGNVTTTIPDGGLEYFQTECPAYTDTVLVELTDLNGTNFLYASTSVDNPGPLTQNTLRNETTGITRRTLTLTIPSGSNIVYIGVQGQEQQNAFNIIVWDQLFDPSDVNVEILEGNTGSMLIYDVGANLLARAPSTSLRYSIIEGNTAGMFTINNQGELHVTDAQQLDPNQQEYHNLTVLAQHTNIACQRARTRISIRVLSNRITFGPSSTVSLSEHVAIDTLVTTITASGGRGPINFAITGGDSNNQFRIGSSTGEIRVRSALNYETTQSYSLLIRARTTVGTTVTETAPQIVNVNDVNEPPSFVTSCAQSGSCSYSINEGLSANTFIGTILATDPDLRTTPNGMLIYSLPQLLPFSVSDSGSIRTTEPLDRESRDTYTMTLSVTDGGTTIRTTVIVRVNDIDDNGPMFTQAPSSISVQENTATGVEVAQYIARDNDIGANSEIVYSITSQVSLPFTINRQTGVVSVSGPVDFETTESYTATVTAMNPNNATSTVSQTVTINVVNLNDNRPQFSQNPYTANLPENTAINVTVITVSATDGDSGPFGVVAYSIESGNFQSSFTINSTSGELKTNRVINREEVASFSLTIEARDGGGRRRVAQLEITITDVNDNPPIFVNAPYQVQVREDVAVLFDVLQVTATDADESGNPNSQITYSITGGNDQGAFTINANTGQIQTAQTLDFETTPRYTLNLRASDGGTSPRSAITTATVDIENVNENPPRISGNQTVNISESAAQGSVVASYTALDPDNNDVSFLIISGNSENKFNIDEDTGRITLANTLDYETTSSYTVGVQASDGLRSTSAFLFVTVLDENEFNPVFQGAANFSVKEQEQSGTLVGTVMATDADGDPANNRVTYSFVQQTSHFTINPSSGEIRTVGVLNREMLTQVFVPPASELRLDVSAQDSASPSRQTTKSITIKLVDINDNSPVFSDIMYENSILENQPGQTVFQVTATDVDLGANGEVRYSFSLNRNTGDDSLFQIDDTTGILSTTGSLDCERQTNYSFTITATDRGIPSTRSSTVQALLNVTDENDNAPVFSMDPYTISVSESSQIDSVLLRVFATDRDKGLNGQVRFSVINEGGFQTSIEGQGEQFTIFAINATTGNLSHQTNFDYERATQVNVTVVAVDLGVPRRSSNTTVVINVMNVDEESPRFSACPRSIFVLENTPLNTLLFHCIALDPDNVTTPDTQAAVTYSISAGNEDGLFQIDRSTGAITNVGALDRERRQFYRLTVVATDLVQRTATTSIDIGLRDINDNSPRFSQSSYTYDFTDSKIQNYVQEIFRVSATDEDTSENGTVRYSLPEVTKNDRQTIIIITASDLGTPQLSSNATLTVNFERNCLLQEYEIEAVSGQIIAYVLCQIEIQQESLNVTLESSGTNLSCSILHNSRMSYQWVHNGSLITLPTLFAERSVLPVKYTFMNTRFEHAGAYACKGTTRAGSLQTSSSIVKIQVAPFILVPPENAVVKAGETATFRCVGSGIPQPTVMWYNDLGNFLTNGTTLIMENVQATREKSRFVCAVSSDSLATATLTVYSAFDLVEIKVEQVSNPTPSDSGVCNYINKTQIEGVLETATKRTTKVTSLQGNNICEESPCLPNPCKNGGSCSANDVGNGYVCTCKSGYIGSDCIEDRNECADDPCFDGTCVNSDGGFLCQCTNTTSGHLCQYGTQCQNPGTCTNGEVCVSTSNNNYICRTPPVTNGSVVITGNMTDRDLGVLSDLVQTEVEKYLAARAAATNRRRKRRQASSFTTLATSCEPRFVQPDRLKNISVLIWLCPSNVTEPTANDQVILCDVLLQSSLVKTCKPPGGMAMTAPNTTTPSIGGSSVTITVVLIDGTGKPIDAIVSEKEIEQSGGIEQLKQAAGLQITSVSALDDGPRPDQQDSGNTVPVGTIVGVVVGMILLIVLMTALVIGVAIIVRRKKDVAERKQLERRMAIQMLEKEDGGQSGRSAGGGEAIGASAVFTSSVDNLLVDQSTGENDYDALQAATKVEDNDYDTLPPRKTEVESFNNV